MWYSNLSGEHYVVHCVADLRGLDQRVPLCWIYICMLVLWSDKPKPVKNTCLRYSRLTVTYQAEIFSSVKKHFTGRQYLALFLDPPFFLFFLIISHQNMECGYADVHGIMYLKVNEEIASSAKQSLLVHISLALTLRPLRVPGSFYVICWDCTLYFFWKEPDVSHRPALLRLCCCMETC